MLSPSFSCAWEYFVRDIHSLLGGNTVKPPSTIYLIVIREVDCFVQAVMLHERPTRCIVPAMAFPKQLNELDLRDARSLAGIEFA